jgi:predicted enzyme related to lactoylglutathione lyase
MKKLNNAVSWFEIPATDLNRARKFYETIFGIELTEITMAGDLKMAMFPTEDGTIGGALCMHKDFYHPSQQGTTVYLNASPDLQEVLSKVEGAGGKIFMPKTQITPEYGYMGVFIDSEGNRVALHSMG